MSNDNDEIPNESNSESTIVLVNNIANIIQTVKRRFNKNKSNCITILYYGHNTDRLRLIEFIFGQQIVFKYQWDVHLIRKNHLPNLLNAKQVHELIKTDKNVNDLSFLKIYYLNNRQLFIDHLLNTSSSDKTRLLPIAFIIDDIMAYTADQIDSTNDYESLESEFGPQKKRLKTWGKIDECYQNLVRMINSSIETLEYCSSHLKRPTYLIVKLDLNTFYADNHEHQKQLLFKLNRSHFRHRIDVDRIPFDLN